MKKQQNATYDLVIIGGGIMGLFTAYYAAQFSKKILLIEKRTIGNKYAASSGYSRSIRNDYLDPYYAGLAAEAQKLWKELENVSQKQLIVSCGVLNIAKKNVTPDLERTYAKKSYDILKQLRFKTEYFLTQKQLRKKYPQFNADIACLDVNAGFLYIPDIFSALKEQLKEKGITILENTPVKRVKKYKDVSSIVAVNGQTFLTRNVVVTVGAWSLEALDFIDGAKWLKLPIIPIEQKLEYFSVSPALSQQFGANKMPVFAYLDVGIYGHPLYKNIPGVKIAYFDPMGAKLAKSVFDPQKQSVIKNNRDFILNCLPGITNIQKVEEENNYYDMTPDNNFIIDELPGVPNVYLGAGFCGTGYKFAPLVGKILAELAFRKKTIYDINRFSAKRFGKVSNFSVLKTLPLYKNFIYPRNFPYLKKGIRALLLKMKLP